MLSIEEAIAHEKELAKEIYVEAMLCHANPDDGKLDDCIEHGKYHEQIAEWLEELKAYKSDDFTKNLQTLVYKQGYNKAIDDFVNQFNVIVDEKCGTDTNNYFRKIIKEIAEQLKTGG